LDTVENSDTFKTIEKLIKVICRASPTRQWWILRRSFSFDYLYSET